MKSNPLALELEGFAKIAPELKREMLNNALARVKESARLRFNFAAALGAVAELRAERDALRKLLRSMAVEPGWHGNPDNHTLHATIFFGTVDPRALIEWDAHGHGKLTDAGINAALKDRK